MRSSKYIKQLTIIGTVFLSGSTFSAESESIVPVEEPRFDINGVKLGDALSEEFF